MTDTVVVEAEQPASTAATEAVAIAADAAVTAKSVERTTAELEITCQTLTEQVTGLRDRLQQMEASLAEAVSLIPTPLQVEAEAEAAVEAKVEQLEETMTETKEAETLETPAHMDTVIIQTESLESEAPTEHVETITAPERRRLLVGGKTERRYL